MPKTLSGVKSKDQIFFEIKVIIFNSIHIFLSCLFTTLLILMKTFLLHCKASPKVPESCWRNNSPFSWVFNSWGNWNSAHEEGFWYFGSRLSFSLALSAVLIWDLNLGIWSIIDFLNGLLASSTTLAIFLSGFSTAAILTEALAWKLKY